MLKLGAAPFHFWFPNIIERLSWINSLILLTWQKLAPLTILSYSNFFSFLIIFIIFSAFIGAIGGLNQTSLRKLLAFSSINHISWLLIAEYYRNNLWIFYFLLYRIINVSIIIIFKIFNLFHLNQIFLSNKNNLIIKFCFFINFFSLGGLPPFLGFLPKWLIIENIIKSKIFFLIFFIIIITLITLFFYTRLTISAFILSYSSIKWNYFYTLIKTPLNLTLLLNLINILLLWLFIINNLI